MKWYQLETWSRGRKGMAAFGLIELGLTVLLVLLAIDSGALWQWLLAAILLFAAIGNLIQLVQKHKK